MGISGLLPFLEKASKPVNISQYSGCTVAVDSYCWLHKGAFSCAEKLARGEQTDQYVTYCIKYVNMLLSHNIKPVLVFDGRHLPAKAETERVRRERREVSRKKAAELLRADRVDEARSLIRRCVDVTHEMASALMDKCHSMGVDCIVAPYEADAQLAYFNLTGVAQIVITEDSDLLLFGCKKVLFKMDVLGNGLLVEQNLIPLAMKQSSDQFCLEKFIHMCILSGCDYLPSLPGIGLAKACKFIKMTADDNICRALSRLGAYLNKSNLVVSQEYKDKFMIAVSMFKHQPVFDPFKRQLTTLTPLPEGESQPVNEKIAPDIMLQLALGNLNPFTLKRTGNWDPDNPKHINKTAGWNAGTINNSIWSKNFEVTKQLPKKTQLKFDKFAPRIDKPKQRVERTTSIEEVISPKKNFLEDELQHFRNVYGIKDPSQNEDILEIMVQENNKESENNDYSTVDDLVKEFIKEEVMNSSKKNPFAKHSTNISVAQNMKTSNGGLSKMSKFRASLNESCGEVSRYFGSDNSGKEEISTEMISNQSEITSPSSDDINLLKDIVNTPEKLPQKNHVTATDTPCATRRNVFAASPKKYNNSVIKCAVSPSNQSFLGMLDAMVSPQDVNKQKVQENIKMPVPKKQTQLCFPDTPSKLEECNNSDPINTENDDPLKVTAIVEAVTSPACKFFAKTYPPSSRLKITAKSVISPKLGPARTVGLKRKKSYTDATKANQPSIFDMFSFQPKAKLKSQ